MKRFNSFSILDDNNQVTGHYCPTGDCYHCKLNVPIVLPSDEGIGLISTESLMDIGRKRLADLELISATLGDRLSGEDSA